jgi:hypothetical protein
MTLPMLRHNLFLPLMSSILLSRPANTFEASRRLNETQRSEPQSHATSNLSPVCANKEQQLSMQVIRQLVTQPLARLRVNSAESSTVNTKPSHQHMRAQLGCANSSVAGNVFQLRIHLSFHVLYCVMPSMIECPSSNPVRHCKP